VEPLAGDRAMALAVNVGAVRRARRRSVDEHPDRMDVPPDGRPHDQVKVASVEAVRDLPGGLVQRGGLFGRRPVPGQGPMIESQPCRAV
jgi:hypothetical protein